MKEEEAGIPLASVRTCGAGRGFESATRRAPPPSPLSLVFPLRTHARPLAQGCREIGMGGWVQPLEEWVSRDRESTEVTSIREVRNQDAVKVPHRELGAGVGSGPGRSLRPERPRLATAPPSGPFCSFQSHGVTTEGSCPLTRPPTRRPGARPCWAPEGRGAAPRALPATELEARPGPRRSP